MSPSFKEELKKYKLDLNDKGYNRCQAILTVLGEYPGDWIIFNSLLTILQEKRFKDLKFHKTNLTTCLKKLNNAYIMKVKWKDQQAKYHRISITKKGRYIYDIFIEDKKEFRKFPLIKNKENLLFRLQIKDPKLLLETKKIINVTKDCIDALKKRKVVIIIGNPGIGKSSSLYFIWKKLNKEGIPVSWLDSDFVRNPVILFNDDLELYLGQFPDDNNGEIKNQVKRISQIINCRNEGVLLTCQKDKFQEYFNSNYRIFEKIKRIDVTNFFNYDDLKNLIDLHSKKYKITIDSDAKSNILGRSALSENLPFIISTIMDYAKIKQIKKIDMHFSFVYPPKLLDFQIKIIYNLFKTNTELTILSLLAEKSWYSDSLGLPNEQIENIQTYLIDLFNEENENIALFHHKFHYFLNMIKYKSINYFITLPSNLWRETVYNLKNPASINDEENIYLNSNFNERNILIERFMTIVKFEKEIDAYLKKSGEKILKSKENLYKDNKIPLIIYMYFSKYILDNWPDLVDKINRYYFEKGLKEKIVSNFWWMNWMQVQSQYSKKNRPKKTKNFFKEYLPSQINKEASSPQKKLKDYNCR